MQSASSRALPIATSAKSFQSSLLGQVTLSVAATGLLAICAHISLPLPFTAVPLTLQTFAVILIGMVLGPVAGFSSMILYLAEGAAGLPVFSPHGLGGVAQLMVRPLAISFPIRLPPPVPESSPAPFDSLAPAFVTASSLEPSRACRSSPSEPPGSPTNSTLGSLQPGCSLLVRSSLVK